MRMDAKDPSGRREDLRAAGGPETRLPWVLALAGLAAAAPAWGQTPTPTPVAALVLLTEAAEDPTIVRDLDGGRLFIVERAGRIRVFRDGALKPAPFLDLSDRVESSGLDQGLTGLAVHPLYPVIARIFVSYTSTDGALVVERYTPAVDPDLADLGSAVTLLSVPLPADSTGSNGGYLEFGPDGYLYIGLGDGGGSCNPGCTAQRGDSLLGKMLRIDVDQALPGQEYAIPATNPFRGPGDPRDEIWALGLHDPWRFSFDRQNGDLYIGDVGQGEREEINRQLGTAPGGQNYGWKLMEGSLCLPCPVQDCPLPVPSCESPELTPPLFESVNAGTDGDCRIVGGTVYRGQSIPAMAGLYVFGDHCSGTLRALDPNDPAGAFVLERTAAGLTALSEDRTGELYVSAGGALYRLMSPAALPSPTVTPTVDPFATPTPTPTPTPTRTATASPTGSPSPAETSTPLPGPRPVGVLSAGQSEVAYSNALPRSSRVQVLTVPDGRLLGSDFSDSLGRGVVRLTRALREGEQVVLHNATTNETSAPITVAPVALAMPAPALLLIAGLVAAAAARRRRR
jgi:glucose/arabinose dehydrogenase